MPPMVGRTFLSALSCGLFASLAISGPQEARPRSPVAELGQSQTDAQDIEALRRAAEQGDAEAQKKLGDAYLRGDGVPRDLDGAARWYRLAADQGDALAQSNLGVMYASGRGVQKDDVEATRWYRLAAEQGDARARYNLGVVYASGWGVQKDDAEAVRWYRLAARSALGDGCGSQRNRGEPVRRVFTHAGRSREARGHGLRPEPVGRLASQRAGVHVQRE